MHNTKSSSQGTIMTGQFDRGAETGSQLISCTKRLYVNIDKIMRYSGDLWAACSSTAYVMP